MSLFSWLFGTKVEPNWYPPEPEEDKVPQTPYRTAPDMPVEDKVMSPIPDPVSDLKGLFSEVVQNQSDLLSVKEKAFFTEGKVKNLYRALIHAMIKGTRNIGGGNFCLSYTDLECGMTVDLMYPFFKMAKKEFLSLDINLTWRDNFNYIWFDSLEFRKAVNRIPQQQVLYSP